MKKLKLIKHVIRDKVRYSHELITDPFSGIHVDVWWPAVQELKTDFELEVYDLVIWPLKRDILGINGVRMSDEGA